MKLNKEQIKRVLREHCRIINLGRYTGLMSESKIDSIAQKLIEHEKNNREIING